MAEISYAELNNALTTIPTVTNPTTPKDQLKHVHTPFGGTEKTVSNRFDPVTDLAGARNHSVIYGRRGSGKTHILKSVEALRAPYAKYLNLKTLNQRNKDEEPRDFGRRLAISVLHQIRDALPKGELVWTGTQGGQMDYDSIDAYFTNARTNLGEFLLLLDELTDHPPESQLMFLEHMKNTYCRQEGFRLVISAVRHGHRFFVNENGQRTGLQLGADINHSIDLDDRYLPRRNKEAALKFYAGILQRYASFFALRTSSNALPKELVTKGALELLFMAAEGNPRDFLDMVILAAQEAGEDKIAEQHVLRAMQHHYVSQKHGMLSTNPAAYSKLEELILEVVHRKKKTAFFSPFNAGQGDVRSLGRIADLYDARVLHLLESNIRSDDKRSGCLLKLDYSAYAPLMRTADKPLDVEWGSSYNDSLGKFKTLVINV